MAEMTLRERIKRELSKRHVKAHDIATKFLERAGLTARLWDKEQIFVEKTNTNKRIALDYVLQPELLKGKEDMILFDITERYLNVEYYRTIARSLNEFSKNYLGSAIEQIVRNKGFRLDYEENSYEIKPENICPIQIQIKARVPINAYNKLAETLRLVEQVMRAYFGK